MISVSYDNERIIAFDVYNNTLQKLISTSDQHLQVVKKLCQRHFHFHSLALFLVGFYHHHQHYLLQFSLVELFFTNVHGFFLFPVFLLYLVLLDQEYPESKKNVDFLRVANLYLFEPLADGWHPSLCGPESRFFGRIWMELS